MQRRALGLVVLVSLLIQATATANPREEAPQRRQSSTGKRVVWTLIGAGIGFGAGLLIGLRQFDDAIDSDRKVWTSALVGAGAGGVAGALLSGRESSAPALRPMPPMRPSFDAAPLGAVSGGGSFDRTMVERVRALNARSAVDPQSVAAAAAPPRADSLRNGMIAGAIVGAIVGVVIVPAQECKSSNPECPRLLRIGVGIPAVAGGAALGALVDKLFEE